METTSRNRTWLYILLAILVVIVVLAGWMWSGYNKLVTEKQNVDNTWRQVETQYQRRADLIPNLVQTVKGAANFEQSTLTAVTNARTQWMNASGNKSAEVNAATNMDNAISRLLVTVESYPQLTATQSYRDLMTELEGTENRISVARKDYNDEVRNYNVLVETFPSNILAGWFGYAPEQGFEAAAGTSSAPSVNFGQ